MEEAHLEEVDLKSFGKHGAGVGGQAYESDDEDSAPGGGQRVQCAQQ